MTDTADILISGGGPAGLAAAACFGAAGYSVICVDPTPPVTDEHAEGADMRTTAILQPGRALLAQAGLWDALAPSASPLHVMQIVDAGTDQPAQRAFHASDLGEAPFGWNLPNWLLRKAFLDRIADLPNVSFRPGVGFAGYVPRTAHAQVRLSDGSRAQVQLVIGADGRASPVRHAAHIDARTTRYGQKALAFAVTHPIPHDNISTEIHRSGGPFTFVPLPDLDGQPRSAVVWMEKGPEAKRLISLDGRRAVIRRVVNQGRLHGRSQRSFHKTRNEVTRLGI
jgi:2-octaprenyl-6-methoxyphenol hydroxylase